MRNRRSPILLLAALIVATIPATSAQVAPPSLPGQTQLRGLPSERLGTLPVPRNAIDNAAANALSTARRLELERVVRMHRDVIDTDRSGAPVVRSEIVAIDPSAEALQRARASGFTVASERGPDELGLRIVVLRAREGMRTRAALRRLQRLDPDGEYDYNHLYLGSATPAANAPAASAPAAAASPAAATAGNSSNSSARIGLIDSGVDGAHPALAGVQIQSWGCDGERHPDRHGTAVASLLAGDTGLGSPAPATLLAADIYCEQPTGGAATGLAEAMAWLARERAGVINISLVGPHNRLLERVVQAMAGRGHVLVAAVGNDGPAAPPLYPAAYPEVIGVTAVDERLRALPEAGRGPQVDFAAPGMELRVAVPDGGWDLARGTSFAAPLVARLAAQVVPVAGAGRGDAVRIALAAQASDLGARGRDNTYGHGLVGAAPGLASADPSR
ncbi:S8 family serine peptidase [Luteimonas suaedae]|uniref:S8 family serine peptidase n=1 Tax=Luteimonas suaedae TaxID=2605430 RepID=UPI0011EDD213|nr:S8 family serine peptidase [Luteimonas suaedae]